MASEKNGFGDEWLRREIARREMARERNDIAETRLTVYMNNSRYRYFKYNYMQ